MYIAKEVWYELGPANAVSTGNPIVGDSEFRQRRDADIGENYGMQNHQISQCRRGDQSHLSTFIVQLTQQRINGEKVEVWVKTSSLFQQTRKSNRLFS